MRRSTLLCLCAVLTACSSGGTGGTGGGSDAGFFNNLALDSVASTTFAAGAWDVTIDVTNYGIGRGQFSTSD